MSSFQTKYSSNIIQYQASEGGESGIGLYVLLSESLSTCDNLDLILCLYTLYSLRPYSMQYCAYLSHGNVPVCISHGISKFIPFCAE